jgi:hypothetical protein
MQKHDPFVSGVHCMAHRTNLVVQTLSVLSLMSKIKNMLVSICIIVFFIIQGTTLRLLSWQKSLNARVIEF